MCMDSGSAGINLGAVSRRSRGPRRSVQQVSHLEWHPIRYERFQKNGYVGWSRIASNTSCHYTFMPTSK